ncbi:ras oncogene family protein, putative [Ichthyophthirius multifiliis]|uniref:Ras oncogene family protein, putative n=1 Tax=Ichthyophthirius multifiliis TaxID=5932 RepID=G0QQ18_ICHMU|nr:ras oncogene family protein, putative [Ichthyophthirius multifiliis]EGR32688.1 ras oncogene family protein, putative [Ichthyophthirius multifiliis]|eukprot:XP_004036674.1 ras oncogene family protein, putative [Ichthyophthirius multifiliis]
MQHIKLLKVVVLGDSGVGKTSIVNRFVLDKFEQRQQITQGASFVQKDFKKGNKIFKLQIWDTAGQEKYRTLGPLYYRDSEAAIVVYDITNKNSFQTLQQWIKDLKDYASENINIVLVGNKTDLIEQEQVSFDNAKLYAKNISAKFQYVSAKENKNIQCIFEDIIKQIEEKDVINVVQKVLKLYNKQNKKIVNL